MFLLVAVWMWIFTVLFFATGGTLQRIGCFTMELKDTEMTAPLDREIDELIHQGSSSVSFPIVFGKILRKISEIQFKEILVHIHMNLSENILQLVP